MSTVSEIEAAGGYRVIYADPPWEYKQGGRLDVENHYPTMRLADIKALPVNRLAAKDCALFLWATHPNLPAAMAVIEAWGFKYKTLGFLWVKRNPKAGTVFMGGGHYSRANSEPCYLATKGKPRRVDKGVHQIVEADTDKLVRLYDSRSAWVDESSELGGTIDTAIGEHSAKPPEVRTRIDRLMGDVPRIELFARERAEGWDVWGNDKRIVSDVEI